VGEWNDDVSGVESRSCDRSSLKAGSKLVVREPIKLVSDGDWAGRTAGPVVAVE
jgi:hypothetical protein